MQVNIATAILIMGNIIQNIVDDYELLARPTKLQAHSLQDAFFFYFFLSHVLSRQPFTADTGGKMLMLFFHSIQGGMGGKGK